MIYAFSVFFIHFRALSKVSLLHVNKNVKQKKKGLAKLVFYIKQKMTHIYYKIIYKFYS